MSRNRFLNLDNQCIKSKGLLDEMYILVKQVKVSDDISRISRHKHTLERRLISR